MSRHTQKKENKSKLFLEEAHWSFEKCENTENFNLKNVNLNDYCVIYGKRIVVKSGGGRPG